MNSFNVLIESYDLQQAAAFLNMHPDTLQRKAAAGEIPGAKIGKNWVFINIHLVQFVSEQYADRQTERKSADEKENEKWHYKGKAEASGMSMSGPKVDDVYAGLLGQKSKSKPVSSKTS
jgi:hypothetical protein